jgi:hypothetical protein
MPEAHELAVARERLDRLPFPSRLIALNIVYGSLVQDEIPTVDPPFARLGLLIKFPDLISLKADSAKTCRRPNRGNRGELAMRLMKLPQATQIKISNTVSVGKHERLVGLKPVGETFEATACLRM